MNENREPVSNPEDPRKLWDGKGMILGSSHIIMREPEYYKDKGQVSMAMIEEDGIVYSTKAVESCGPNCKFRLATITCPFFKEYPCLVGCTVRQHIRHEGIASQDMDIFVTSQSGRFLIGEECILDLGNPNVAYIRILRDKRGIPVVATKHKSLLSIGLGTGVDITDVLKEVKHG